MQAGGKTNPILQMHPTDIVPYSALALMFLKKLQYWIANRKLLCHAGRDVREGSQLRHDLELTQDFVTSLPVTECGSHDVVGWTGSKVH